MTQSTLPIDSTALDLLEAADRILLTGHIRPDGDCIGAQAALYPLLQSMGKQVFVVNSHEPEVQFDYLRGEIPYGVMVDGKLPEHDLVILMDCSELSRTGAMADILKALPCKKMVIDHHVLPDEPWWDGAIVDTTASATGVLVYRLAKHLNFPLPLVARMGVFTSIVSDTGWFKYSNTDGETLRIAGELVSQGLAPEQIYGSIYQRKPAGHPRDVGRALEMLSYHAGGALATVTIPLSKDGANGNFDSDDVLDLVRSVECVEVVLFIREIESGVCKLSARSKSDFDVNRLARAFGGGGHVKASGATLKMLPSAAEKALVDAATQMAKDDNRTGWGM
ncbi:MAG: bifunctional oligoribonuclease/PAP phosphatase NrnA [Planctomycetota bacterium]|nr:bifunctional oligoribonuclease/PAP phosphatase NrnA [Planctomycetota bacterium]